MIGAALAGIATAKALPSIATPTKTLPKSLLLSWSHKANRKRCGVQIWNVTNQASYNQYVQEAVFKHMALIMQGHDVTYQEFKTLRFV
jgi:hypothetical protein